MKSTRAELEGINEFLTFLGDALARKKAGLWDIYKSQDYKEPFFDENGDLIEQQPKEEYEKWENLVKDKKKERFNMTRLEKLN
mmetsp:Transcript_18394/g.37562  ORF Transcript_18394/g.37562 Transcript_18394/m.37562 type:complete len:83 (+) Transcript_18394:40-288(+)